MRRNKLNTNNNEKRLLDVLFLVYTQTLLFSLALFIIIVKNTLIFFNKNDMKTSFISSKTVL